MRQLTDIFLPWMPHTLASVEKRQAALKIICTEQPEVAWKLLESLLPGFLPCDSFKCPQQTSNIISPEYTGIFLIKQLIKG
jgi:hypothetical protein